MKLNDLSFAKGITLPEALQIYRKLKGKGDIVVSDEDHNQKPDITISEKGEIIIQSPKVDTKKKYL